MSDEVKPSEAWQDVKAFYWDDCLVYAAADVNQARAADAQQIAADEQENVVLHNTCGHYEEELSRKEQQIAALRAENEQLKDFVDSTKEATYPAYKREKLLRCAAEAKVEALQAEQARLEQENELLGEWNIGYQKKCEQAAKIIATLTAQRDGSLPTRQPKP